MSEHITDRIDAYLDDELARAERAAVEDHMEGCPACRDAFARSAEVAAAVRSLPTTGQPARDLWPGIRDRVDRARVIEMPGVGERRTAERIATTRSGRAGGRRVTVRVSRLLAAGIALALLSGGAVWTVMGGPRSAERASVPVPGSRPAASLVRGGEAQYETAIRELEALLAEGRDRLAPETLATLEESLATIEEAIAEAERALAQDPRSDLLNRILSSHRSTKLRILRQAASGLPRT